MSGYFNLFLTLLPLFVKLEFLWLLKHRCSVKHFKKASEEPLKLASFTETISCPLFLCLSVPHWHMVCRIAAHNSLHSTQLLWCFLVEEQNHQALGIARLFQDACHVASLQYVMSFLFLEIKWWLSWQKIGHILSEMGYIVHLDNADLICMYCCK